MINRILIRIKVVQTLYTYLLTRSDFRINERPEKGTRDSLFAYLTYITALELILKISGQRLTATDPVVIDEGADKKHRLAQSKIAGLLQSNAALREAAHAEGVTPQSLAGIAQKLHDEIVGSAVFGDYSRKRSRQLVDDVNLWSVVVETIFANNKEFEAFARENEGFTIKGFMKGLEMTLDTLQSFTEQTGTPAVAKRNLLASLDKARQLYFALLRLPVEITRLRAEQLETAKDKYLPTADDLNPNLRMVENRFVDMIEQSQEIAEYFKANPFEWNDSYFFIKKLLDEVLASEIYKNYMEAPTTSFETDCDFWRDILRDVILPSDTLAEALENDNVYWNDDLEIMGTFVVKTIRRCATEPSHALELLPMYKDEEDSDFGTELLDDAIKNADEYRALIDSFIDNSQWDAERIALMDVVIMTAAIAEILNFPSVPIPVSLNEYIEIANFYSTPRSGQFINGILYSVIRKLIDDGRLNKPLPAKAN